MKPKESTSTTTGSPFNPGDSSVYSPNNDITVSMRFDLREPLDPNTMSVDFLRAKWASSPRDRYHSTSQHLSTHT